MKNLSLMLVLLAACADYPLDAEFQDETVAAAARLPWVKCKGSATINITMNFPWPFADKVSSTPATASGVGASVADAKTSFLNALEGKGRNIASAFPNTVFTSVTDVSFPTERNQCTAIPAPN